MNKEYNTEIKIKVEWADLDLFGHVNNVAFFRYIQSARVNYCEHIGLSSISADQLSFMVASTQCQFKKPLRYPGEISVFTKADWLKNSSLQLSHLIVDQHHHECALGTDVLVVFDHHQKTKVNITAELKNKIQEVEGKGF